MEEEVCPECKSDRYFNPNLKLLYSYCNHKLCENCIQRIFGQGPAPCPTCHTQIRKTNFFTKVYDEDDLDVERDIRIRRRIYDAFHQPQSDFSSLREYNDHLEELEDLIFELSNNSNILQVEMRIEEARKAHDQRIKQNRMERENQARRLRNFIDAEVAWKEQQRAEDEAWEARMELLKESQKKAQVENLISGSGVSVVKSDFLSSSSIVISNDANKNKGSGQRPLWREDGLESSSSSYKHGKKRKMSSDFMMETTAMEEQESEIDVPTMSLTESFDPFQDNHENPITVHVSNFYVDSFLWQEISINNNNNNNNNNLTLEGRKSLARTGGLDPNLVWKKLLERSFDSLSLFVK